MMPDPAPLGRSGIAVVTLGYVYGLLLLGLGITLVVVVVRAVGRVVGAEW